MQLLGGSTVFSCVTVYKDIMYLAAGGVGSIFMYNISSNFKWIGVFAWYQNILWIEKMVVDPVEQVMYIIGDEYPYIFVLPLNTTWSKDNQTPFQNLLTRGNNIIDAPVYGGDIVIDNLSKERYFIVHSQRNWIFKYSFSNKTITTIYKYTAGRTIRPKYIYQPKNQSLAELGIYDNRTVFYLTFGSLDESGLGKITAFDLQGNYLKDLIVSNTTGWNAVSGDPNYPEQDSLGNFRGFVIKAADSSIGIYQNGNYTPIYTTSEGGYLYQFGTGPCPIFVARSDDNNTLSIGYIIIIILCGFIVSILIVGVILVLLILLFIKLGKSKRNKIKLFRNQNEEKMPLYAEFWDGELEGDENNLKNDVKLFGRINEETDLLVEPEILEFGLGKNEKFPVGRPINTQWLMQSFADGKTDKQERYWFKFLVPDELDKYEMKIWPGEGVIGSGQIITINVQCTLKMTTHVRKYVKLFVSNHPEVLAAWDEQGEIVREEIHTESPTVEEQESMELFPMQSSPLAGKRSNLGFNRSGRENRIENLMGSDRFNKYTHTFYSPLNLNGELSIFLDPEEIVTGREPIGEGGFGTVYRGMYRGTAVAVKIIKRQNDKYILQELDREIKMLSKLRSVYVVSMIGCVLIPGKRCICFEYCRFGSVIQHLYEKEFKLTYRICLKMLLDMANAIYILHTNGIIHRDIKPDNFMIVSMSASSPVLCKIGDFGTAKSLVNPMEVYQHTRGVGTPAYMSPEQFVVPGKGYNGKKVPKTLVEQGKSMYSAKVDVYAFGIMMWMMINRSLPFFEIKGAWRIPGAVLQGARPTMEEGKGREGKVKGFEELMKECWDEEPGQRPNMEDVVKRMETLVELVEGDKKLRKKALDVDENVLKEEILEGVKTGLSKTCHSSGGGTTSPQVTRRRADEGIEEEGM